MSFIWNFFYCRLLTPMCHDYFRTLQQHIFVLTNKIWTTFTLEADFKTNLIRYDQIYSVISHLFSFAYNPLQATSAAFPERPVQLNQPVFPWMKMGGASISFAFVFFDSFHCSLPFLLVYGLRTVLKLIYDMLSSSCATSRAHKLLVHAYHKRTSSPHFAHSLASVFVALSGWWPIHELIASFNDVSDTYLRP